MDDENGNNGHPAPGGSSGGRAGGSNSNQLPAPFRRIRRPSSSIISSTTSPIFQAPLNPNQPLSTAHHSRQRHSQNNISNNNHFGSGDIDEDVQSSSNSRPRAIASSSSASGSNSGNRPQSPLGSPDSSTYWGPSPSPMAHNHGGYRAPLTPGGNCVVSSSTSDDIPQSPDDVGGNSNHSLSGGSNPVINRNNSPSSVQIVEINDNNHEELQPPPAPRSRLVAAMTSSLSSRHHHLNLNQQNNFNQDLNQPSTSSSNFNISPLRNKIKKASSFERFSAQAATNSNSTNNANSLSVTNESSISSGVPLTTASMSTINASSSNSVSMAGSSRLLWDSSLQSALAAVSTASTESLQSSSSGLLRSLSGTTEKFHIKIPSKKLAAKIASVFEQEQLNESLAAAAAAASSSGSMGSSSIITSGPLALSSIQVHNSTGNSGLIISHQSQHHQQQQQIPPPSTLAQILNQSPNNINVISLISEESILNSGVVNSDNLMIRELSDVPLNLTETNNATTTHNSHSQQQQQQSMLPQRNPVISLRSSLTSSHSKKMHLTPKQKLLQLHRIQSAELIGPMSPPPQQSSSQMNHQIQMHSNSQSISSQVIQIPQQQSSTSPIGNFPIIQETQQQSCGSNNQNHIVGGPHSPQQLEPYPYESLLRSSRDDFNVVQDSLGKVVVDDPNSVSILYDPDYSNYCYQGIFGDEIFTGNNNTTSNSSARQLLMMPAGNLQDSVDQPHGHFGEFVLGLTPGVDDHENDRREGGDLQLNNDGNPGSQQQCLDSSDALSAIKSQSQADSALRSLLMMEPLRNHNPDDSWLQLTAEYQSRTNCDVNVISSRGLGGRTNSIVGNGSANSSFVNMSNSMNNSNAWINEWPRTSSWQTHPSVIGGGDQDEGMDMSMLEQDKNSNSKRIQIQLQSGGGGNNDHNGMDDMDLANGLPILSSMPMPMDLHQPMSMLQHGSNASMKDSLPMDLQQHNRMDMDDDDDEPVNLMAVNIEQELAHHHNSHHNLSHQIHLQQQQQQHEGSKLHNLLQQSQNHHHQQQGNNSNSYTLQIQNHHGSPDLQQQQQTISELNGNNQSSSNGMSSPNIIDERRIIRVKKNKDNLLLISSLDDGCLSGHEDEHEQKHPNVIMDKPIQPKSFASLPSPFSIVRLHGNTLGVFTSSNKSIPPNTRLGPVEGPLKKVHADDFNNINAPYPCLVMPDASTNELWQLDRTDDEYCNWMKFVRLAHSYPDQNAMIIENDGFLYFITCKEISPKTELLVGYSLDYAQKYGFPYFLPVTSTGELVEQNMIKKFGKDISSMQLQQLQQQQSGSSSPIMIDQQCMPINSNNSIMHQQINTRETKSVIVGSGTTYQCFECDQDFVLVEDLTNHLNISHKEEEEIRKPKKKAIKKFQSPQNMETSGSSEGLGLIQNNLEIIAKVQSTNQNQLMSADSSVGRVESSSQERDGMENIAEVASSGSSSNRAQDNRVSTGGGGQLSIPPKVKCTMCYKSFATKERLDKHMIVHSDEDTKPLKCNFCTKRFLTNSALAGHIKTHAEEGKCFECPMCDFSTQQLLSLKEHVQTHKNRDTGYFYCPQCNKNFLAYHMIRKHIRAFHGPRQFGCEQCTMSFPTSDKLKLHKLKHSDHREFLCAECGRQFKRKDKLREHTKRIHEASKKRNIEITIGKDKNCKKFLPKYPPEEYQRFPFKCQDCMVGFKRRGMLVNHMVKRHPEKKLKNIPELNQPILRPTRNFFCLYCDRVYKSSSKRKAHILKAHPGKPVPPQLRGLPSANSEPVVVVMNQEINLPQSQPIGTVVQTLTDDGDPRHGIMNVSTNNISSTNPSSNGSNNLVSTTSTIMRKEIVVGKVENRAHPCNWCHRQYATRAKALQHMRKQHIHLMPIELQTPRTQKNNVTKAKMEILDAEASMASSPLHQLRKTPSSTSTINLHLNDPLANIPDSSSATSTTTTIQTVATTSADGLNETIGFLLTTTVGGNGGDGLPSEIVMVPVQNLGSGNGSGLVLQATSHNQPLTINGVNVVNPSQNIAIITSNSNNNVSSNNSGNNVISNTSSSVSVTHPILTQME